MYHVETEEEVDGRWIAEVEELPGVLAYGATREEAVRKAQALSLHVLLGCWRAFPNELACSPKICKKARRGRGGYAHRTH